jgi:regulator of cell morphogenesis and NO signaling
MIMSQLLVEETVGQLVVENPSRARVFEKLGIDYCCGGKKPLKQACEEMGLDVSVVLSALQSDARSRDPGEKNWATASLTDLADHIESTHHAYLKEELPRLEFLTSKVASKHGDRLPQLIEVKQIFAELKAEMDMHMMKEERILFPLCRQLDRALGGAEQATSFHCGSIANPIEVMIREHDDAGNALEQIRSLTGNYTPPEDACNTFRAMYDSLAQLERDMHQHVHKENNILFPKAIAAEKLVNR